MLQAAQLQWAMSRKAKYPAWPPDFWGSRALQTAAICAAVYRRRGLRLKALLVVANGPYYGTGFTVAQMQSLMICWQSASSVTSVNGNWFVTFGQSVRVSIITAPRSNPTGCRGTVNIKCKVARSYRRSSARSYRSRSRASSTRSRLLFRQQMPTYKRKDDPNPPVALPVAEANKPITKSIWD